MRKGFVLISPMMGIAVFLLVLSTVNLLSSEDARLNMMLQDTLKFREVAFHANRVTVDVFNASDWMLEEKLGELMTINHGEYDHGTESVEFDVIHDSILYELGSIAKTEFATTIADTQITVYSDSKYNVFMNEWDTSAGSLVAGIECLDDFASGEDGTFIVRMQSVTDPEPLVVLEDSSLSTSGFKSRVEAEALQKQAFHPRVRVFRYAWIVEDELKAKFNSEISVLSGIGPTGTAAEDDLNSTLESYFNSLSGCLIDDGISIESAWFSGSSLVRGTGLHEDADGVEWVKKTVKKIRVHGQLIDNRTEYLIVSNGVSSPARYSFTFELCATEGSGSRDPDGLCV